jgi:hypothetical protein
MSTLRWCLLFGLVVGIVWAFGGISGAFVALIGSVIGGAVGLVISRNVIDFKALLGNRDDDD